MTRQPTRAPADPPWPPALTLRRAGPQDLPAIGLMLARCSRGALLARFHGGASGEDYFRRVVGSDQAAVVAAWDGDRCVGTAELVAAPDGSRHLGVLVEDDRQRQGVGTVLVQMLASLARAHGWGWFVADVDAEDRFAVARLRAVGRTTVTRAGTDVRVRVDL